MTNEEVIHSIQEHMRVHKIGQCPHLLIKEALDMAIDALREQENRRWIPVTERLPECDGRYLCMAKSYERPGSFYHTIIDYDKYGFKVGQIYIDYVTHWMPLPEPPRRMQREM